MTAKTIEILSVNISEKKGTVKHPVPEITINEIGIVGDAHAGTSNRMVSLLAHETIERFSEEIGRDIAFGEFAENITMRGLKTKEVWLLDRLRIGNIELEVTKIGKECHGDACAIFREVGRCVMPKEGIFCRVVHGGVAKAGDVIEYIPKILRYKVITLSDRASRGEYEDRSGPRIGELVASFMQDRHWLFDIDSLIIPDDPEALTRELHAARDAGCDVVLTTGGTGVGTHDITPDVVAKECSKTIPGIMEHIRTKYGVRNPAALLSRGVAGVLGQGLVFTLPGSKKAVEEYMNEIFKTLEHLVLMLHGLDVHHH